MTLRSLNAKLVAFTRARRPKGRAEDDPAVTLLPSLSAPVACIVAKSWKLHVEKVLRTTPEENLESVRDTVAYLAGAGKEVIFDAEHYFDGFRDDPAYALAVLRAAAEAGATTLVLCDTNGGTLPTELKAVVARTVREFPAVELGIHTHNDSGCGVANALVALEAGATHVQGTINGIGEAVRQLRPRHDHRQYATQDGPEGHGRREVAAPHRGLQLRLRS